ncbi:MAG: transketolase [Gammaproteobacteria bacterium]|jgi:transketolase|nr:transketolase [Gammaproteobacteria bacterium]
MTDSSPDRKTLDRKTLANAIRALSMDAVQRANSGHPGMPMGMADIAEVLWNGFLRHNPADPHWWDRDRFVLSNGHGSMLHYALLHLSGYDLSIDDLKAFRQLHSRTAGHPEYGETPGVETTTGPLGQGLANGVGMALAEKLLAARFNRDDITLFDHHSYVFLGDGCLMEGISHEVCSLAGTLKLGKLICLYDDNNISIDGEVEGWFTDDTPTRFRAYGWQVIDQVDGHDPKQIQQALQQAHAATDQPTLICCQTIIGFGAPNKQGTAATHGAPLGDEEIAAARQQLHWPHAPFEIPDAVYQGWDATQRGQQLQQDWQQRWQDYQQRYPDAAAELQRRMRGELPDNWQQHCSASLQQLQQQQDKVATRKASQMALESLAPLLPELLGGSADLAGSNNTIWSGSVDVNIDAANSNYIYYGVREFGMTAIANGLALHGGLLPYVATFLVFSDYARNAVRMSALLPAQVIHVYTHDSIGLGEDGPTHQPIEHVTSLRLIPGLSVWRPCDAVETQQAWIAALENSGRPTALVLTRQGLPPQQRDAEQLRSISRGGYILHEPASQPQALIIATGSEVQLAMTAAAQLQQQGLAVRVVSMPNPGLFASQQRDYQEQVLPPQLTARVAVEAGVSDYWYRWIGSHGQIIGIDRFGASAPAADLFREYGLTAEHVAAAVKACLN